MRLRELINRGYRFIHPASPDGAVIAIIGIRAHDNVIDVIVLNSEDDVRATRMPDDEDDIYAPRTTLWQTEGDIESVLDELLALPDDQAGLLTPAANRLWRPASA